MKKPLALPVVARKSLFALTRPVLGMRGNAQAEIIKTVIAKSRNVLISRKLFLFVIMIVEGKMKMENASE